ncbi:hypothetical protein O3G_MSEX012117 [Manduca sexta]|uniref:Phosphotriesterase-related protein n=1 Tax=Manduca sexta TaxID=7130 RepID=A0A921ZNW8_MANSE|nr:hypothetical protein O3G_MSEX012117 [Manduca sexta]
MAPKVQTVLGDVDPKSLGRTLTHEHLAMDFSEMYSKHVLPLKRIDEKPFNIGNIGTVRQYPYSSMHNLFLNDEEAKVAILEDLHDYKEWGGGTIVENSTEGLKRDVTYYKKMSQESGVQIVAGTGFYIERCQEEFNKNITTEQMYNHMLQELTEGCVDDITVKAGFMGEVASVWPIRDFERRAIVAAGELQKQIGCGVSFHPHREVEAPFEIVRLYLEAGGSADKCVMSHLDRTLADDSKLLEFSELGTYCQFDLFGVEVSYYQLNEAFDMPSDAQRISKAKSMITQIHKKT